MPRCSSTRRRSSSPDYAQATLYDLAVPVGGTLWQEACALLCNPQSSTTEAGVARITIPVLERELPHLEHLSGSFAYHQQRPDLGTGAWEFAGGQYAVAASKKKETVKLTVERRGPPTVTLVEPLSPDPYLFDDDVPLEATGTDLSGRSFDELAHNFLWWSPSAARTNVTHQRVASVPAGATFGSGTHDLVVHGIDPWGWVGTDTVEGLTVETVDVAVGPASLDLVPGGTATLSATVTGANDQAVTWSSNQLGVAGVNAAGEVTAVGPGTVTIVARSVADPTRTATATVTVENLAAAFTVTPGNGDTATVFAFDAAASVGDITAYAWAFGDGAAGTGPAAPHSYPAAGSYLATLTVTSASGATAQSSTGIEVVDAGVNLPPAATFTASPTSGNPGLSVSFDASASYDLDGAIVSWDWDFGDGTAGSGEMTSHTYTGSGTFTVLLTITDDDGSTGTATTQVQVNHPPVAAFTVVPDAGDAPLEVTVNASGSTDVDGQIERYSWDFGDGTLVSDGEVVASHVYVDPGVYSLTLTVEDDGGRTASTGRTVTVSAGTFTATVLTGEPYLTYSFDAAALFTPSATYSWDFGDGGKAVTSSPQTIHRYTSPGTFAVTLAAEAADGSVLHASQTVEVAHPEFDEIVAISAGRNHSLALAGDGVVRAWGQNRSGQLGDGSTGTRRLLPAPVGGLDATVAVAAGAEHSLALVAGGTVWAWGGNWSGELGDGTTVGRTVPGQVSGLEDIVAIAGYHHSLAVTADGDIWAWGHNGSGQVGNGSDENQPVPVWLSGLEDMIAVAAGQHHSLALGSDGTVWGWGANNFGQLGNGTRSTPRLLPAQVLAPEGIVAVAAGAHHSLALAGDGTVWGWGGNHMGQVGDGASGCCENRSAPVQVVGLHDIVAITAGNNHSLALAANGTVWAWGSNGLGQLGDGTVGGSRAIPGPVASLGHASALTAADHTLALTGDAGVWAWGYNHYGQLGDGTTDDRATPVTMRWWN
jgi:alpha-tubulin suppressor-like RCC1 family protein/PKD repeat protein